MAKYELFFEKTTYDARTASREVHKQDYRSAVEAGDEEEAILEALRKLQRIDMRSPYFTNITDAYVLTPSREKLLIPEIEEGKKCKN